MNRGTRIREAIGVRPSPGAAMWRAQKSPSYFAACKRAAVAVPEDGHTPSRRQAQPLVLIAESRTAPGPFLRQRNQPCLVGIALDVSSRPQFVVAVSHISVPVTVLPEPTFAPENLISLLGCVPFPNVHQLTHRRILHLEKNVNVIRHDHPCPEIVLNTVAKSQRVLNQLRNVGMAQMTFAPVLCPGKLQVQATVCGLLQSPTTSPTHRAVLREKHPQAGTSRTEPVPARRDEADNRSRASQENRASCPLGRADATIAACHAPNPASRDYEAGWANAWVWASRKKWNSKTHAADKTEGQLLAANLGVRPSRAQQCGDHQRLQISPELCLRRSVPASGAAFLHNKASAKIHTFLTFLHLCTRGRAHSALTL